MKNKINSFQDRKRNDEIFLIEKEKMHTLKMEFFYLNRPCGHGFIFFQHKLQFQDLSNNFLSAPSAKLLLLAGVDRLDTNLTVAQMQVSLNSSIYRASHIILDFLQSLSPKYLYNTRKILHFLQEIISVSLIKFFKMILSS